MGWASSDFGDCTTSLALVEELSSSGSKSLESDGIPLYDTTRTDLEFKDLGKVSKEEESFHDCSKDSSFFSLLNRITPTTSLDKAVLTVFSIYSVYF